MSSGDQRSDQELVALCNEGSRAQAREAFNALYNRHKDYVLRVAFRYVREPDSALDVLQDTFTYLLRKFPPPGDGLQLSANLRTLLYTAAKNTALTRLRNQNDSARDPEVDPDELATAARDDSELGQLLRGLSPNEREIVTLRFVDDLSLAEIAETLQIPVGTAKSRLHKAVSALRNSPYVSEFFEK